MSRSCIIVLGMHRSGTSALSGLLHECGVYFGKSLMPPAFDNQRGFYENDKIVQLNDRILTALDRTWHTTTLLPEGGWSEGVGIKKLAVEAENVLKKEFGQRPIIGIKDPRLCLLLPFWLPIIEKRGFEIKIILLHREMAAIRSSLHRRDNFNAAKTDMLTGLHLMSVVRDTGIHERLLVSFENLLQDEQALYQCLAFVNVRYPDRPLTFINPTLATRRNKMTFPDHPSKEIESWLAAFYDELPVLFKNGIVDERIQTLQREYHRLSLKHHDILLGIDRFAELGYIGYGDLGVIYPVARSPIEGELCTVTAHLEPDILIKKLVVRPDNIAGTVKIQNLSITYNGEPVDYILSDNSAALENGIYTFDTDYPRIIIAFDTAVLVNKVEIVLGYPKSNVLDREVIADKPSRSIFLQIFRFFKLFNAENYRILRSALRRESPKQILRNLIKRLNAPERSNVVTSRWSSLYNLSNNKRKETTSEGREKPHKIIYVCPSIPEYDRSSGGRRATRLLSLLTEHSTVCVFSILQSHEPYHGMISAMGVEIVDRADYRALIERFSDVDVIIYGWYYTYYDAARLRHEFPFARIIIDSVDIHWVREERALIHADYLSASRVQANKKREMAAYQGSDEIWVVTREDGAALQAMVPEATYQIVSNIHEMDHTHYERVKELNILFFGNYGHHPNIEAAYRLVKKILPIVRSSHPEIKCLLAGANMPDEVLKLQMESGVECLGYIEEEEIADLYRNTFLVVAPLLSGAGIKGKITEAISHSLPVLTNHIGNEGIYLSHGVDGLLAETDEEFGEEIISAWRGDYDLDAITSRAQKRLYELVGTNKVREAVVQSLFKKVDICIVTYNKLDLLENCIESILTNTNYPRYRILVYSNGCTDGTVEFLEKMESIHGHIKVFYAHSNDVFVRPNNVMMHDDEDADKVLLNNDTVVTEGWLMEMSRLAYKHHKIGIVGPKILYPDGRLQEFGSALFPDGSGINYGKNDDANAYEYSQIKAAEYVSGCAMYIKNEVVKKIGYLDDDFHPCYAEDSDYCYRAWKSAFITVVTPQSVIIHMEGASAGRDDTVGFKQYQRINIEKLWSKHRQDFSRIQETIHKANRWIIKSGLRKSTSTD